ncbi:MAG: ATP-binding cassette domain-containing protein, partial [Candidatus Weimeria sp.]
SFLLIDEPTNHLDERARKAVGEYLNRKKGFILVSHDRALLDSCIDHVLSINRADIEIQKGNFSSWWENKQAQDSFEKNENEKLKKDISRLSESARSKAVWSDKVEKSKKGSKNSGSKIDKGYVGHKSAKMMKRSKSIEARQNAAIEEKSKLLKNVESEEKLSIFPLTYRSDRLIELKDISLFYGDKKVTDTVNFSINQGERIAVTGKNGSGKSSILKLICGEDIKHTGQIIRGSGITISYVPQDTSSLHGSLSDFAEKKGIDESIFLAVLRKMDFDRSRFAADMSDYSEGQKKKVMLAASLCEKAHLYVWDEPLNYIDVFTRIQLEELLAESSATICFVEHDSTFTEKTATKIVRI